MENKTYNIITIGCQMNKSDSERLAGHLENQGLKPAQKRNLADFLFINTCGVRQSAEDRVYGLIPKIKKENPKVKIILTGCLSERQDVKKRLGDKVDTWLPITQITNYKLQITNKTQSPKHKLQTCNYLKLSPKYNSKFSAFIPIGNGCNNFCSYCVVPYARGREVYRPSEEILDEVKNLIKKGYGEIILIAQSVNSYKSQITNPKLQTKHKTQITKHKQINFAKLLKMVNNIPGDFWIRFATSHPKDMSDELIKAIAESDKVCRHIHLPAQAGDNEVLRKMNRGYTLDDYINLVDKIRKVYKSQITRNKSQTNYKLQITNYKTWQAPISITTDIIVGFPGENRNQFTNTKKLFKEIKFDMAYIARYSPRPGTAAEKLKDNVSKPEKKRREEELMKILRQTALENNKKYIGKVVKVLIEGLNKKKKLYGKTETGKNVKFRNQISEIRYPKSGKFVDVKIEKAKDFGLEGILK